MSVCKCFRMKNGILSSSRDHFTNVQTMVCNNEKKESHIFLMLCFISFPFGALVKYTMQLNRLNTIASFV